MPFLAAERLSLNPISHVRGKYDLVFKGATWKKKFKSNESENISIPGAMTSKFVLLRMFLNFLKIYVSAPLKFIFKIGVLKISFASQRAY
jgi:hypothetical protein